MTPPNDPSSDYAPNVRAQYEDYPFPLRDPWTSPSDWWSPSRTVWPSWITTASAVGGL